MKRRERDRDLDAEIRSHLEMAVRDRIGRGEEPRVAELSARRELGSEALVKEVTRASWGWAWWERRAQDLRYAFRQLRKNRGFTATAILTLALGIGANSAIFSAVNGVLLNPLPYPHAERLTTGFGRFRLSSQVGVSPADFVDYRARQRMFEQFGAYFVLGVMPTNWGVHGESRQLSGAMVTAGFFEALGQSPVLGRSFTRADEQAEKPPAAILSYRMWHDLYGADPGVLNSTASMDSRTVTIVGVMPTSLDFPSRADFWFPIPLLAKGMTNRNAHSLRVVGLLRPDTPMSRAQTDLDGIAAGLAEQFPESNKGWGIRLESMRESMVGDVRSALLILLGAVALVLLIACVNMSNLLLARGNASYPFALRSAPDDLDCSGNSSRRIWCLR